MASLYTKIFGPPQPPQHELDHALLKAAEEGKVEMCQKLLAQGANIHYKGPFDKTPLHLAVENKMAECVDLLLEKGADIEMKQVAGLTPLHVAVLVSHLPSVKALLAAGAYIEARSSDGSSPLTDAAQKAKTNYRTETQKEIALLLLNKAPRWTHAASEGSCESETAE